MFFYGDLKEKIEVGTDTVVCPVKGCKQRVERMRKGAPNRLDAYLEKDGSIELSSDLAKYFCGEHGIFITPSTFIYKDFKKNLLWLKEDEELFRKILEKKRVKAQLHHDKSEDAVTWNVIRYLEKNDLLPRFLESVSNRSVLDPKVIYWSYDQSNGGVWSELRCARKEFGEHEKRSSEPDIIITSKSALYFIEAKFTSKNVSTPSNRDDPKKYVTGGNNWYDLVFKSPYKVIAIDKKKYELLRLWLLGTWTARLGKDFYLINLTLDERERTSEKDFNKHINESERRKFKRITWEEIYKYILTNSPQGQSKDIILRFFRDKTRGYDSGILKKAFSIDY